MLPVWFEQAQIL